MAAPFCQLTLAWDLGQVVIRCLGVSWEAAFNFILQGTDSGWNIFRLWHSRCSSETGYSHMMGSTERLPWPVTFNFIEMFLIWHRKLSCNLCEWQTLRFLTVRCLLWQIYIVGMRDFRWNTSIFVDWIVLGSSVNNSGTVFFLCSNTPFFYPGLQPIVFGCSSHPNLYPTVMS